VTEYFVIL